MSLIFWGCGPECAQGNHQKSTVLGTGCWLGNPQPTFAMSNKVEQAQLYITALLLWHFPLFSLSLGVSDMDIWLKPIQLSIQSINESIH